MKKISLDTLKSIAGWNCVQELCDAEYITAGFTSDLLSDIMANAPPQSVLITLQGHLNTVAVASLVGIKAIVICSNRLVPNDMLEAARHEKIMLLTTSDNQFQATVKLNNVLVSGNA